MNQIGYYEHNKKYKLFFDFMENKESPIKMIRIPSNIIGIPKSARFTPQWQDYTNQFLHILKIQCYSKEMFEHFVNAWNLDKSKIKYEVNEDAYKNKLILLFKSDEWHETRQFIVIVEKYLNDRGIELVLDNEMIGAILMMKELG